MRSSAGRARSIRSPSSLYLILVVLEVACSAAVQRRVSRSSATQR